MAANIITGVRIALLPVIVIAILRGSPFAFWLFLAAALSDFADGFVARRLGQVSDVGKVLDALADRLLTAAVLLAVFAAQAFPSLWIVFLMIGRDALMAFGALFFASRGQRLEVTFSSKVATTVLFTAYSLILLGYEQGRMLFFAGLVLYLWVGLVYAAEGNKLMQASRHLPTDSQT